MMLRQAITVILTCFLLGLLLHFDGITFWLWYYM
jgi:hypothetical protein